MRINKLFRDARINRGMSQAAVAKSLNWASPQYVSNYERGECDVSVNLARQLMKFFKLKPTDVRQAMARDYEDYLKQVIK